MMKSDEAGGIPVRVQKGGADVPRRLGEIDGLVAHAVLATASEGRPHASLVSFALLPGGTGAVFATPRTTRKYRNILGNSRVSLLMDTRVQTGGSYTETEVLTLEGEAAPVRRTSRRWRELMALILRKHPALTAFINAPTTALVFVEAERCVHVGGFQEVTEWRPPAPRE